MKNGKFDKAKFDRISEVLLSEPTMSFFEAVDKIGLQNMPSTYDLASIRRYFHERGKEDFLLSVGKFSREDEQETEQSPIEKSIGTKLALVGHCNDPRVGYLWTNEYIGFAPEGHPAQGKLILAKVSGIDMNKTNELPLSWLYGGAVNGQVIPSDTEFVECEDLIKFSNVGYREQIDCGYIINFEERNGLMVPVTEGIRASTDWQGKVIGRYDKARDIGGFGTLMVGSRNLTPMSCRPCSWSPKVVLTNLSEMDFRFKVLRKESLDGLLK